MEAAKFDSLLTSEWNKLVELQNLLKPFSEHTNIVQTDTVSLSFVIPLILDLDCHLEKCKSSSNASLTQSMNASLHKYFDFKPFKSIIT